MLCRFPIISDGKVNCSHATLRHVQSNGPAQCTPSAAQEMFLVGVNSCPSKLNGNGMFDTSWGGIIVQLKWISFILYCTAKQRNCPVKLPSALSLETTTGYSHDIVPMSAHFHLSLPKYGTKLQIIRFPFCIILSVRPAQRVQKPFDDLPQTTAPASERIIIKAVRVWN